MTTTSSPRVTYADMLEWPDDGQRYELYDGEVIVVPAPILRHQRIASHVMHVLRDYEEETGGMMVPAPFDIVLSEHDVVQPDVVYFGQERRRQLNASGPARVAPDLAVEIVSPGTEARDRGRKMELLARYRVPELLDCRSGGRDDRRLRAARRCVGAHDDGGPH